MAGETVNGTPDPGIFDRWARRYDATVQGASPADWMYGVYDSLLDLVASAAVAAPGDRVLDLGTGTGNLALRLMARGARVAGVDPSPDMLEVAREKLGQDVELRRGHFLSPAFEGRRFDAIASTYALHHLTGPEKTRALHILDGLLVPAGRVVIGDLMFRDGAARDAIRDDLLSRGLEDRWLEIEEEHYALVSCLKDTWVSMGYSVEIRRLTDIIWVITARSG